MGDPSPVVTQIKERRWGQKHKMNCTKLITCPHVSKAYPHHTINKNSGSVVEFGSFQFREQLGVYCELKQGGSERNVPLEKKQILSFLSGVTFLSDPPCRAFALDSEVNQELSAQTVNSEPLNLILNLESLNLAVNLELTYMKTNSETSNMTINLDLELNNDFGSLLVIL